ncbi:MAG: alpha/beta hydrolase domain-containing protein, partial [Nocardioides sp.]
MTVTFTPLPTVGVQLMSAAPGPDLVAVGYREDEYVVSGRARRFDQIAPAEADFATRVLIRRPVAAGTTTLVVEWLNVSSGDDAAPDYTYVADEIVRRGHVWVGVSAQFIGVEGGRALVPTGADPGAEPANGLKGRDPQRYAALHHPGDAFSYGIVTAITEALSDPGAAQPLAELQVRRRIAVGESQSAYALTTYVNTVQPRTECFDAFLVHSRGSATLPLGDAGCGVDLDRARHQSPVLIRDDLTTPVIVLETETDVLSPRLHY